MTTDASKQAAGQGASPEPAERVPTWVLGIGVAVVLALAGALLLPIHSLMRQQPSTVGDDALIGVVAGWVLVVSGVALLLYAWRKHPTPGDAKLGTTVFLSVLVGVAAGALMAGSAIDLAYSDTWEGTTVTAEETQALPFLFALVYLLLLPSLAAAPTRRTVLLHAGGVLVAAGLAFVVMGEAVSYYQPVIEQAVADRVHHRTPGPGVLAALAAGLAAAWWRRRA